MAIKYKSLVPEDYDKLIMAWKASGLPARPKGRDSRDNIVRQMQIEPNFFIGAFDNDELIGVVIATSDLRKGWINRLAVLPDYRRKGIAAALLKIAEDRLFESGVGIISCLVMDDNRASIDFFEAEGYYCMPDVLYFRKVLNEDV